MPTPSLKEELRIVLQKLSRCEGAIVYRLGHILLKDGSGVRFPVALPNGKCQIHRCRLALLGDQIIRNYGLKNQLAILKKMVRADIFKK